MAKVTGEQNPLSARPKPTYQPSTPPIPRGRPVRRGRALRKPDPGLGCTVAVLSVAFSALLAVLGLMLPPFLVGERLFGTPFTPLEGRASAGSLSLIAAGGLSVRLAALPTDQFLGEPGPDDPILRAARAALPANFRIVGEVYRIERRGAMPQSLTAAIALAGGPPEAATVDLYGYSALSRRWRFLPAERTAAEGNVTVLSGALTSLPDVLVAVRLTPLSPAVGAVLEPGQPLRPNIAALVQTLHPAGLSPNRAGALEGVLPGGVEFGRGYAVVPVIRNYKAPATPDVATVESLLSDDGARAAHIQQLADFARSKPYAGIAIDYRGVPAALRARFTGFITALGAELHSARRTLTVVLPFPDGQSAPYETGGYDWVAIGAAADVVQVTLPTHPRAYMPDGSVRRALGWAIGLVSRAKLQPIISLISGTPPEEATEAATSGQNPNNSDLIPVSYKDALRPLENLLVSSGTAQVGMPLEVRLSGEIAFGVAFNMPALRVVQTAERPPKTVFLMTEAVLRDRLGTFLVSNLAGVMVVDLAAPGGLFGAVGVLNAYQTYAVGSVWAVPNVAFPAIRWEARQADRPFAGAISPPDAPFRCAPEQLGEFTVSAYLDEFNVLLGSITLQAVP